MSPTHLILSQHSPLRPLRTLLFFLDFWSYNVYLHTNPNLNWSKRLIRYVTRKLSCKYNRVVFLSYVFYMFNNPLEPLMLYVKKEVLSIFIYFYKARRVAIWKWTRLLRQAVLIKKNKWFGINFTEKMLPILTSARFILTRGIRPGPANLCSKEHRIHRHRNR